MRQSECGKIADKYIEYELILVVIDMVLHRQQVYRHLLFNRLPDEGTGIPVRWRAVWPSL